MKPFLFLLFVINSFAVVAQEGFNGIISWKIERGKETIFRDIYVKGDSVKVEEWSKLTAKNKSIIILDLKHSVANILSSERKTYLVVNAKNEPIENIEFTFKTEEADSLLGLEITKWIVHAYNLSRISNYWFSASEFSFYKKMLQLLPELNFLEKQFLQLPLSEGVMPIKAEYSNINNVQVTTMEVIKIERTVLPIEMFRIPKGYKAF